MSIARQLAEELSKDEEAGALLIEQLITHIARDRRVRRLILTAIVRDIATRDDVRREAEGVKSELKKDIEGVRNELKGEIDKVRSELKGEIDGLRKDILDIRDRVSRLEGQMSLFIRLFIAFNVPILIGVIGTLLLLLWRAMIGAPIP